MINAQKQPSAPSLTLPLLVFCAGVSAALHVWKLPPALPVLQQNLTLTLTEVGWLVGVFQLAGMFLGLLFGLFVQRIGVKQSIILGLILLACASLMGALMYNLLGLLIFRIIEGFALLLVTMSAPSLIRQLAPHKQLSFLMALWSSYFPLASMLSLLVGSIVLQYLPWTGLWIATGMISLVMAILLWRQFNNISLPAGVKSQPWTETKHSIKTTLTVKAPWLLSISFALYSSQWVAIVSFLPIIYRETAISGILIGMLSAMIAGVNIVGNLFAGKLLQRRIAPQWLISSAFIIMILMAFVAFGLQLGAWSQFIAICLFSGFGGMIPATLFNLAVQVAPTPVAIPMVLGLQQQWISLGQFLGPLLTAITVSHYGWSVLWYLTGFMALLGLSCSHWLCEILKKS